jgi:hypothetical protein
MVNMKVTKCAHIPCLCEVPPGAKYCGDACRDAGRAHRAKQSCTARGEIAVASHKAAEIE